MKKSRRAHRHLVCLPIALLLGCSAAPPEDDTEIDGPEPTADREDAAGADTVSKAVSSSCSTGSIKGLSQQIIEEAACVDPGSFVMLPSLPNLQISSNVFPYLEAPAKSKLVAALNANPGKTLVVNSMLRTVAQQYLLYRWYKNGSCGIKLAATPGKSNHETGLALDIGSNGSWRTTLSKYGFKWFGGGDPPHFDYVGAGAVNYKGMDVRAFQRLWNRNHPEDKIAVDGAYGPQTEGRLKQAPAQGFPIGAVCNGDDHSPSAGNGQAGDSMTLEDVVLLPQLLGEEGLDPQGAVDDDQEHERAEPLEDLEALEHECEGHQ
jgi:hypothetical protein